jgi:AcrR family transcriptional regulator
VSTPPLESLLPPRRERSGEATRKRILDGAELEFAAKGFDGARLAAIARAADVPQALIHHYFDDKEGLYRAVLERAIGTIAAEGWKILDAKAPPKKRGRTGGAARFGRRELEGLIEAFVGMLVDFYTTHGHALRILRSEAMRGGTLANELVRQHIKPQLDDIVARFEEMRAAGEVREDVEPRHLCLSTVAMACFPTMEESFIDTVWGMTPKDPAFVEARKREIVRTVMARIAMP